MHLCTSVLIRASKQSTRRCLGTKLDHAAHQNFILYIYIYNSWIWNFWRQYIVNKLWYIIHMNYWIANVTILIPIRLIFQKTTITQSFIELTSTQKHTESIQHLNLFFSNFKPRLQNVTNQTWEFKLVFYLPDMRFTRPWFP